MSSFPRDSGDAPVERFDVCPESADLTELHLHGIISANDLMSIDRDKQIVPVGVRVRLKSDVIPHHAFVEHDSFSGCDLRRANQLVHPRLMNEPIAELDPGHADIPMIEHRVAVHANSRDGNGSPRRLDFRGDELGRINKFVGHDFGAATPEVNAFRRHGESIGAGRIAELSDWPCLDLIGIQLAVEQGAFIEHRRRKRAADEHQGARMYRC
ncbi:MAG: hypothetical protein OXH99_15430 [Bryobacterales bacterium]|nr:hypothetical protein [Bryobacterales bacterium]